MSAQTSLLPNSPKLNEFNAACESIGLEPGLAIDLMITTIINIKDSLDHSRVQNQKMSREEMFNCMRGHFKMSNDFDEPMEDFKEYM